MKTTTQLVCVLAALLVTFNSCRKDDSVTYFPDKYNTGSGSTYNTTISGRILDESGQPLQGVNAEIESQIAITDNHGLFTLSNINVNSNRFVVKLTKTGYLDQYFGGKPFANDITFFKATMIAAEGTFTVTSASGGITSLPDGAIADFPSNAFVSSNGTAYSGSVTVKMSYINKDDANFGTKIPGNDLRAIDAGGEDKVLESFGMMNIELNGSAGQSLNLAPGSTAQLSFPIAASQLASAPPTIPIWYFDTESGLWKEDGVATRNGNIYICSVSHFTWWNCDLPYGPSDISGYVKNCNGTPVANVSIYANGIPGYTTNGQGFYTGTAPAGYGTFNVQAFDASYTHSSQVETVPNLSVGQMYVVPDLVLNFGSSTTITGTATDCDNSPASALVTITNTAGTYWDYIYTNGTFSFTVPQGSTYIITASYGGLTGQVTITAAQAGLCATYNLGFLPVCNLINPGTSNFSATLITSQFGNQALSYSIDQCSVTDDTSIPNSTISLSSTDIMTNFITNIEVSTGVYQPGNFSWDGVANSLHMTMSMNGDPVDVDVDLSSGGGNTINTAPQPGGMIEATFSGSVILSGNSIPGGSISGYISGSFNVYRNN